jgi:hypothetical protein
MRNRNEMVPSFFVLFVVAVEYLNRRVRGERRENAKICNKDSVLSVVDNFYFWYVICFG